LYSTVVHASGDWKQSSIPFRSTAGMIVIWHPPSIANLVPQILLIGGADDIQGRYLNDIWSLSYVSGGDWSYNGTASFSVRGSSGIATIQGKSSIIIAGGQNGNVFYQDVWCGTWNVTSNSLGWRVVTAKAPWSARPASLVSTTDDYLYLNFASASALGQYSNDVWTSADAGYTWLQLTSADSFSARTSAAIFVLGRQVTMIGGCDAKIANNDVWTLWTR